ncbi:MAG: hypothetical protein NVS9B15_20380 [Acidobacteriaceae bacterium]
MVRILNHELGVALKLAAQAADVVLAARVAPNRIRVAASIDGSLALQLDLERFYSTSNAALASAYAFGQSRGRGRPTRVARRRRIVDEYPSVWEIRVKPEFDTLDRLARKLREWGAYPRGIERGLPFIMDVATMQAVPKLALLTTRGEIDVILDPTLGGHQSALSESATGRHD